MTKTMLTSGILSLLALTIPTHAFAVTIGFEGLSNGTVVTNQFPGVVLSANAGFENQVTTQPGIGFGDNFICTASIAGSINCAQETILTFSSLVNNLSFYQVGDNASGVVALVDVFENGLFSSTVDILGFNDFSVPNLVDLNAFSNVSSIRIYNVTDPGGLGWDNFQFKAVPVPWETDALPVVGSTLLFGLGVWAKRKRKLSNFSEKDNIKIS